MTDTYNPELEAAQLDLMERIEAVGTHNIERALACIYQACRCHPQHSAEISEFGLLYIEGENSAPPPPEHG